MTISTLPRKFKIGATIIEDPCPTLPLEQAHEVLCQQYPMLRNTHIFESDARVSTCGTFIEYEAILPPVKTQG